MSSKWRLSLRLPNYTMKNEFQSVLVVVVAAVAIVHFSLLQRRPPL